MPFPGTFPVGLFAGAASLTLSQVLSATDASGAAFTLPNGIQAGDLIVVLDYAVSPASIPTAVTPAGFTNDINVNDGVFCRMMLSHKIADGSEGGTSVSGMDGGDGEGKLTYVFRGNRPIVSATVLDTAGQVTNGDPSAQVVNVSGVAASLIVIGGYACGTAAVSPRNFDTVKDGEINVSPTIGGGSGDIWLAYKVYNFSPADSTIDMGDEGSLNGLVSCYIACA